MSDEFEGKISWSASTNQIGIVWVKVKKDDLNFSYGFSEEFFKQARNPYKTMVNVCSQEFNKGKKDKIQ